MALHVPRRVPAQRSAEGLLGGRRGTDVEKRAAAARQLQPSRRTGRPDDWTERVEAWVKRTCAEQGVPVKITDPLVLVIAKLLRPASAKSPGGK